MVTSMEDGLVRKQINSFRDKGVSRVVGLGGGSACDFAKLASQDLSAILTLIPSILSVDAPFTRAAGVRVSDAGRVGVRYRWVRRTLT